MLPNSDAVSGVYPYLESGQMLHVEAWALISLPAAVRKAYIRAGASDTIAQRRTFAAFRNAGFSPPPCTAMLVPLT